MVGGSPQGDPTTGIQVRLRQAGRRRAHPELTVPATPIRAPPTSPDCRAVHSQHCPIMCGQRCRQQLRSFRDEQLLEMTWLIGIQTPDIPCHSQVRIAPTRTTIHSYINNLSWRQIVRPLQEVDYIPG